MNAKMDQQIMRIVDYKGHELQDSEIKDKIEELKLVIKNDSDINGKMRQDDDFLLRYLHCCDFNIEQAHLKFKKYYNLILNYTKWFSCATPKVIEMQLIKKIRLLLDTRDRDGRLIILAKMGNTNPSQCTLNDMFKLDDIMLELGLDDPVTLRKGFCGIIDVKDMSFRLMQWATPKNFIFYVKKLDALPLKDLKIHVVNKSRYMDACIAITWPFLPPRLKENIFFHYENWNSLHEHIDPSSLPVEYGGTNNKSYDDYINDILGKDQKLVESSKYINFLVKDVK